MSTVANTSQSDRKRDRINNAVLAILDGVAVKVIKFIKEVGRSRCPWVYYLTAEGKKRATFLSPKAFQGYRWNADYSKVVNLESGAVYEVGAPRSGSLRDRHCTCLSWYWEVRTGKKRACKHQDMRAEFVGKSLQKVIGIIDKDNLPKGCLLKRTDNPLAIEYWVYVLHKDNPYEKPGYKKLGRVRQEKQGIFAQGSRSYTGELLWDVEEAIAFLLSYHGMKYSQVLAAAAEVQALKSRNRSTQQDSQKTVTSTDSFGGFHSLAS